MTPVATSAPVVALYRSRVSLRSARSALQLSSRSTAVGTSLPALRRAASSRVQGTSSAGSVTMASADSDFDGYAPKVAFLFPGQGAQAVGMAKARVPPQNRAPQLS